MPYLWLAGTRAGSPVEILNTEEAAIRVDLGQGHPHTEEAEVRAITIGASQSAAPSTVHFRASFVLDEVAQTGTLSVHASKELESLQFPLLVGLPLAEMRRRPPSIAWQLFFYPPAATVRLLRDLRTFARLGADSEVELRIVEGTSKQIFGAQKLHSDAARQLLPKGIANDLLDALSDSLDLPAPMFLAHADRELLLSGDANARNAVIKRYEHMALDAKPALMSLTLRTCTHDGRVILDEFLGAFSDLTFGPPTVAPDSEITQDELTSRWAELSSEFMISAAITEDMHDAASGLRKWTHDRSQAFPLKISSGPPNSPFVKTLVQLVRRARIDRFWYTETPVVVVVRPISGDAQWEVEAAYWESVGDTARAGLLRDRIAERSIASTPEALSDVNDEYKEGRN